MFQRLIPIVALMICQTALSSAQELKLYNPENKTLVMRYLPRNKRPNPMDSVEIPAHSVLSLKLRGDDPFDVTFALKSETGEPGIQMKVGTPAGVPLKQLAAAGEQVTVQITLAEKKRNGQKRFQVMSTTLGTKSGNDVAVISTTDDATEFVDMVIHQDWATEFVAGNGQVTNAEVDFNNVNFQTDSFSGSFSDLTVFDGDNDCRIYGRWSALNSRGDVSFTVKKSNPNQLIGEYTFDGNPKKFRWSSRN